MKVLIQSLAIVHVQEIEDKDVSSVEDIGWHENESLSPGKIHCNNQEKAHGPYELHSEIWS